MAVSWCYLAKIEMNNYKNWPKPITSQRHLSRYKKISATMKVFTKSILHGNAARQLRWGDRVYYRYVRRFFPIIMMEKLVKLVNRNQKCQKKIKVTVFLVDGVLSKWYDQTYSCELFCMQWMEVCSQNSHNMFVLCDVLCLCCYAQKLHCSCLR